MLSHEDCGPPWGAAPREVLQLVFERLPLKDRCQTVGGVSTWWRQVALEANLLPDLNLNCLPLFAQRTRSLPDFYAQRNSFITWLLPRRSTIRRLCLTAERWEDDSNAVYLRMAVADLLAGNLECLRLVCTDSGQTTSAFLRGASRLQELQLDFWGRSNSLPRAMADCTQLTKLSVQCSSGLEHYKPLGALRSLQDLSVVDCDWQRLPDELLQLGLTSLRLRFADFADGRWLPQDAGRLSSSLQVLELSGCHISTLPEELSQLGSLTRLVLDRNFLRELPASLARLQGLEELSCEGCASLRELPPSLAAGLPLRSLNLLHTGVLRLPMAHGVQLSVHSGGSNSGAFEDDGMEDAPATPGSSSRSGTPAAEANSAAAAAATSSYLRHLTELRWGVADWEAAARASGSAAARRWVGAQGEVAADGSITLPDLSPLLQASSLRVLQLAHVPATAEAQLEAVLPHLPLLRRVQVNSAVLLG